MLTRSLFGAAGSAAVAIAAVIALASGALPAQAQGTERGGFADVAENRLEERIDAAIRAGGPFFNAEERAVIERACGYPAGSWDGFQANMSEGVFRCSNGRRADSREVRAVMRTAGPRIGRRVSEVMERADIREAIEAVAREAAAAALASIDQAEIARDAAEAAGAATREAMEEARIEIERATEDVRRRRR